MKSLFVMGADGRFRDGDVGSENSENPPSMFLSGTLAA
jgi:hypothetical protein